MFFDNQAIGLSKTKESEKRRSIEASRTASTRRLAEEAISVVESQQAKAVAEHHKVDLGFRKSKSRVLFEAKMDRVHRAERVVREELARIIGEIVVESTWIDAPTKVAYAESIAKTSAGLALAMFEEGTLSIGAFAENRAIAVRELLEAAKKKADDDEVDVDDEAKDKKKKKGKDAKDDDAKDDDAKDKDDDAKDDAKDKDDDAKDDAKDDDAKDDAKDDDAKDDAKDDDAKDKKKKKGKDDEKDKDSKDDDKVDPADAQEGSGDDDSDGATDRKSKEKKAKAVKAIVAKTREHVMDTIATEKEIAAANLERNRELAKQESGRLIRPRREAPTLWRTINVGVAKMLNESGNGTEPDAQKVAAESLVLYTFLEALSVMNLISPTPAQVASICGRLS